MYPLSSKKASAKNKIKILGKNVNIPPTPAIIPSTKSDVTAGLTCHAANAFEINSLNHSTANSKYPDIKSPTVKVSRNTSAIIPKKIGIPKIG